MAYNEPVRLYLKGDRVEAAKYVRVGRVLLWKLARTTTDAGSASARRTHELPGGVRIELVLAGQLASIVIDAPLEGALEGKIKENFVVWARDTDLPDGIDPNHPQQMLRYDAAIEQWTTLFYDAAITDYPLFTRPKGTYKNNNGVLAFPDGIKHAGNIDWVSVEGVRISWYGPPSRYFIAPYIQPRSQYGKFVFMLGQTLLDVDQYITDSTPDVAFDARYVMGAAIRGKKLYVVHADLPLGTTVTGTAGPYTIYTENPYPVDSVVTQLCSYDLADNPDPVAPLGVPYVVVPRSRQVLRTETLTPGVQPWFFNQSGTAAVCSSVPLNPRAVTNEDELVPGGEPSDTQQVHQFFVVASGGTYQVATVQLPATGEAQLASDFRGDTLVQLIVRRESIDQNPNSFTLKLDNATYPMLRETDVSIGNTANSTAVHRILMYADLRTRCFVFIYLRLTIVANAYSSSDQYMEMWLDGVLVKTSPLVYSDVATVGLLRRVAGGRDFRNAMTGVAVAPGFVMYGIYTGTETGGLTSFARWDGRHGGYWYLAYPGSETFGSYAIRRATSGPYILLANFTNGEFDGNKLDFDGHYSVLACASYDGAAMYSGPGLQDDDGVTIHMLASPEPAATLPILTGVTGAKERYHPIWLLGTLPK